MKRTLTSIEITVGERLYQLLVQADSPLGELHDVLFQMKAHVIDLIKQADQPVEVPKADVVATPEG
jgi:hypothetical protein